MRPSDRDYYESRRVESLKRASQATDGCAARVHRELAMHYGHLLAADGQTLSADPRSTG
jgi:hypothetical protein